MSTAHHMPAAVTRDGRNRFHSALPRERRMALESLLLPVDHPDLWSDADLERREQAEPVRTMATWPDSAIRTALERWGGPALESAQHEAAARGWEADR